MCTIVFMFKSYVNRKFQFSIVVFPISLVMIGQLFPKQKYPCLPPKHINILQEFNTLCGDRIC